MPRVFSPTGFNVIFPSIKCSESRILWIKGFYWCWRVCVWGLGSLQLWFWIRIFRIREVLIHRNITFVGANGIRPPMIQIHFPTYETMEPSTRSSISSCFNINLPLTPGFESGFTGLQRTSSIWVLCLFVDDYFSHFFSPMRNVSARGFDMKAPFKIIFRIKPETLWLILEILKILIQTNGCCARNFLRRLG